MSYQEFFLRYCHTQWEGGHSFDTWDVEAGWYSYLKCPDTVEGWLLPLEKCLPFVDTVGGREGDE